MNGWMDGWMDAEKVSQCQLLGSVNSSPILVCVCVCAPEETKVLQLLQYSTSGW